MKNFLKLKTIYKIVGIIAFVTVIGFLFVTCDTGMQQNQSGLSGGGAGSLPGTYYYSSSWYITFRSNGTFTAYDGSTTSGNYSVRGSTIELSRSFCGYYWTIINSNRVMDGDYDYWDRR